MQKTHPMKIATFSEKLYYNSFNKIDFMLRSILIIALGIGSYIPSFSQVVINENDAAGNANVALDIQSTTKGVLFPVMTTAERDLVKTPATGLMIFNRSGGYFNYFDGTNWKEIDRVVVVVASNPGTSGNEAGVGVGVADPDNSAILHVNSTTKGFLLPRNATAPTVVTGVMYYKTSAVSNNIFYYNGTVWAQVSTTQIGTTTAAGAETAAGLLIGTGTIAASAKMEVSSTTKGMLMPRLTDAERDAIQSPAEGLTIYNTTSNTMQYYAAATWYRWAVSTNYGQVIGNPGFSCKDILDINTATAGVDGNSYYIDPDGAGAGAAYQCYCDMTGRNGDGGGWTLVENTGPAQTNTNTTAAAGTSAPVSTGAAVAFAKISDADINLVRGGASGYATAIFRIERQNNPLLSAANKFMYVVQNKVFDSNSNAAGALNNVATSYANALVPTTTNATATYARAMDTWSIAMPNQIIFNYSTEGFITNNNTGQGSNNRSESCVLLWVKKP